MNLKNILEKFEVKSTKDIEKIVKTSLAVYLLKKEGLGPKINYKMETDGYFSTDLLLSIEQAFERTNEPGPLSETETEALDRIYSWLEALSEKMCVDLLTLDRLKAILGEKQAQEKFTSKIASRLISYDFDKDAYIESCWKNVVSWKPQDQ